MTCRFQIFFYETCEPSKAQCCNHLAQFAAEGHERTQDSPACMERGCRYQTEEQKTTNTLFKRARNKCGRKSEQ